MADRRLQRAAQRAASQAEDAAPSEIDSLLAAMGGSAVRAAHAPFGPATSGVGEEVWEPGVHPARLPTAGAGADPVPAPSVTLELRRRKAMRQLQAGIEREVVPILGDVVCAGLELLSSVTLRKGNGLVERWLMCRHAAAPPGRAREPLLPPSLRFCGGTAAHIDAPLLQELQKAGASEETAEAARAAMGAEAETALNWLRRQRDDSRQSTEVRVRTADAPGGAAVAAARAAVAAAGPAAARGGAAAEMLEVRLALTLTLTLTQP